MENNVIQNPFELILSRLDVIELKLDHPHINSQPEEKELLSRSETAELLNVNQMTLRRWTLKGKLKSYGIGGRVYYKRSEVMDSAKPLNP